MQSLLTHLLLLLLPHLLLPQPSNSALLNKKGKGHLAFFIARSRHIYSVQRHPVEALLLRGAPKMRLPQIEPSHTLKHQLRAVVLPTEVCGDHVL
jgi:hypothetical protein